MRINFENEQIRFLWKADGKINSFKVKVNNGR